ncbi:MAG: Malic enzyme binding domain protein, partial [Patescibacteria group bacterium]|nr:Malic enzyme binding domain protein [Patescibacteria group bacterium]
LLDARASRLTPAMKIAAATALAGAVATPSAEEILPSIIDFNPADSIAQSLRSL